jgi:hypothetical protein
VPSAVTWNQKQIENRKIKNRLVNPKGSNLSSPPKNAGIPIPFSSWRRCPKGG